MKSACVVTLGCKANQFESAAMEETLRRLGYSLCPFEHGADLVVVNTCTVTAASDAQSRKLIRRARRCNPSCRILVTGCYAQLQPRQLVQLPGVECVFGNMEKARLDTIVTTGGAAVQVGDIAAARHCPPLSINAFAEHSRAFVQIQTGCNSFCSYCIIPYARGRSRSVPPQEVVAQVERLVKAGYYEIVLTGIHIGQYGRDLPEPLSLARLVTILLQHTAVGRIRLGSVEPQEFDDELLDIIAAQPRLCPHVHIPLQSGSDSVLRRMNRHYTGGEFIRLVEEIAARRPACAIGIDVICAFPGESAAEHSDTVHMLEQLPISYAHVFPYSRRSGTAAAAMPGQIDGRTARQRAAQLRKIAAHKWQAYAFSRIGACVEVVFANHPGAAGWRGVSAEYLTVQVRNGDITGGRCHRVVVDACGDGVVFGHLAKK